MAKLAIVGTGFTGTSLGLALRQSKLFSEIHGYDTKRPRAEEAKARGAIDEATRHVRDAAEGASVIVVTAPTIELEDILRDMQPALSSGCLVTETGPWKRPALEAARVLPSDIHFIAGRPVLDNAGKGPEEAKAEVFSGAVYCLTPTPNTATEAINAMSSVVAGLGAQPYFLSAEEHDGTTAGGELLPSALLAAMAAGMTRDRSWVETGRMASDSFRRLVVLAEELDSGFWREASANGTALSHWIDAVIVSLLDIKDRLVTEDPKALTKDWDTTIEALARWRKQKRQLVDTVMPPASELRPNLFGSLSAFDRLRGKKSD